MEKLTKIPAPDSKPVPREKVLEKTQEIIDEYCERKGRILILEAGCGTSSHYRFPDGAVISGIDISWKELAQNPALDEKIVGDIQTCSMSRSDDIVICRNVLEHLDEPQKALDNLLAWTKVGGILIISIPNVFSIKGIITKFTPYWFHKFVYRYIYKFKTRPFKTFLRRASSPEALLQYFRSQNVEYMAFSGLPPGYIRHPFDYLYRFLVCLGKVVSLGRYNGGLSDFHIVMRKIS